MAATDTKHPQYNRLPPQPTGGYVSSLIRKFASNLFGEDGDIRRICPVGRGVVIGAGCFVQTGDGDTGTAHVFDMKITNGATTKTIISGSTAGQAGGLVRPTKAPSVEDGVGFVVPDDGYYIYLECTTAAGTEQAADIVVGVEFLGARDNQLTE